MSKQKWLWMALLLILVFSSAASYLSYRAVRCRDTISRESKLRSQRDQGIFCLWRIGKREGVETAPTLWEMVCGARPVSAYINNLSAQPPVTALRARDMAEALRFFGSLEEIGIQNAGDEAMAFLLNIGRQPHLTELHCFRVPITDDITPALAQFPKLREMSLGSTRFTGKGFPLLPELMEVNLSGSPVSVDGLRAISASPKLVGMSVESSALKADHYQAIAEIEKQHPRLKLSAPPPSANGGAEK